MYLKCILCKPKEQTITLIFDITILNLIVLNSGKVAKLLNPLINPKSHWGSRGAFKIVTNAMDSLYSADSIWTGVERTDGDTVVRTGEWELFFHIQSYVGVLYYILKPLLVYKFIWLQHNWRSSELQCNISQIKQFWVALGEFSIVNNVNF